MISSISIRYNVIILKSNKVSLNMVLPWVLLSEFCGKILRSVWNHYFFCYPFCSCSNTSAGHWAVCSWPPLLVSECKDGVSVWSCDSLPAERVEQASDGETKNVTSAIIMFILEILKIILLLFFAIEMYHRTHRLSFLTVSCILYLCSVNLETWEENIYLTHLCIFRKLCHVTCVKRCWWWWSRYWRTMPLR